MSADLDTQHFGQPEEAGTPGVARYRAARKALAAYMHPDGKLSLAQQASDLAAALQAFMPTYSVVEYVKGRVTPVVIVKDLPDLATAQNWIAHEDYAARRTFEIRTHEAGR